MSEIYLSKIAGDQAQWLSVRQSLIAGNVANANTPGYKSQDVKPMDENENSFLNLVQTNGKHLAAGIGNVGQERFPAGAGNIGEERFPAGIGNVGQERLTDF